MRINTVLRSQLEDRGLDVDAVFLFLVAVKYLGADAVKRLLDCNFLKPEEEDVARIMFVETDFETGEFTVNMELFESDVNQFGSFLSRLVKEHGFTSKGHPQNQITKYAPIAQTAEVEQKFQALVNDLLAKHGSLDENRLLHVVVEYYRKVETPKNLGNYFATQAAMDYESDDTPIFTLS